MRLTQIGLSAGQPTYQFATNFQFDAQTNRSFAAGRGRWVGGGAYGRQNVDSADPQGVQTNYDQPETADNGAVFGQMDYRLTDRMKTAVALRIHPNVLTFVGVATALGASSGTSTKLPVFSASRSTEMILG